MAPDDEESLEAVLEQICETHITEQHLEQAALDQVMERDVDELNDLPRLYRLEVKRLLNENGETKLAEAIND
jgi:hypothetical protein